MRILKIVLLMLVVLFVAFLWVAKDSGTLQRDLDDDDQSHSTELIVGRDGQAGGGSDGQAGRFLQELGYVDWVDADPEQGAGVVLHLRDKAWAGYGFYAPQTYNRAFLIDMDGEIRHQWHAADLPGSWQIAELLEGGDLLVMDKESYVARLSLTSEVRWTYSMRAHHDLTLMPDGRVVVIGRQRRDLDLGDGTVRPVVDDMFEVLDGDTGEFLERIWVSDLLGDRVSAERKAAIDEVTGFWWRWTGEPEEDAMDVFHTNSIEVAHRAIPGVCEVGDLLISVRELDLVGFLDLDARALRWTWGPGVVEGQHHPTLTDQDTVVIFDNGTRSPKSRVIEVDPLTGAIVWQYGGQNEGQELRSWRRGGSQKLPNGNMLIMESNKGHVFEVTREGEVVWRYYNPFMKDGGSKRGAVFRMLRHPPELVDPLLKIVAN